MGCYRVYFGDYFTVHHDGFKYFNYFDFQGRKYPIGSYVKLTDKAMRDLELNSQYRHVVLGGFRVADHFIDDKGYERWTYIIGKIPNYTQPFFHTTSKKPEEMISEVFGQELNETVQPAGELEVEFKEPNYFPKDWEVEGVMFGWVLLVIVWIGAFIFKDWWIRLIIQIGAGWYFGSWREKKINEAITNQKFKK